MVVKKSKKPVIQAKSGAKTTGEHVAESLRKMGKDITDITEEIRKLAHQFFAERNYEHGCDFDDWLKAEKIIKKRLKIFK
ncbi:MAG: DUF2934 domain-containing protein [Candidatus Omnitrophota bacterium]